jgi:hypothetical protein
MARNRVTSLGYTFVNGTRDITITDPLFAGFAKEDIRLIINETQKVVYFSSMQKTNATVSGSIITLDSFFPVLETGDEITIEMDLGFVGADAVAVEINEGKQSIANALTLRGQASTSLDSFDDMAGKIENIVGDITVTPVAQNDPNWHDLAFEVAQYVDFVNPYAFAVLLNPAVESIDLSGADAWKLSDGRVITSAGAVTFGANEAGREDKLTKFVIFRKADPYFIMNFSNYTPTIIRQILGVYNVGMDWSQIDMDGVLCSFIDNDASTQIPTVFGSTRTPYVPVANQFQSSRFNRFIFLSFRSDATEEEKELTISNANFMNGNSALNNIQFPEGLKTLTISGASAFLNATNLTSLIFPTGLQTLTISGATAFQNATNLTSLIFPTGLQTLTISGGSAFNGASNLTSLIFPTGLQTLTISGFSAFQSAFNLTSLIFPTGLQTLTISGSNAFLNATNLTSLIFPTGLQTLTISGTNAFQNTPNLTSIFLSNPSESLNVSTLTTAVAVTKLELEDKWNRTVSLTFANLTAQNTKDFMLDKLVDKRFDKTNPSVVDTDTTSPIVTDTNGNGNFLEVFRVGDTINIAGGGNRTIASIESRNQLTLTANAATTGTDQAYNMNKTLTLSATVKTALATAFGANWPDPYTAKGWTIA